MSMYQHLKAQAAEVRKMAALFTKSAAALDHARKVLSKTGSAAPAPTSGAERVRLAQMAKHASTLLYNTGVLQTPQQVEVVSALLMNHEQALQKVAQLAKLCERLPRGATVVTDTRSTAQTANEVWDQQARSVLASLPG